MDVAREDRDPHQRFRSRGTGADTLRCNVEQETSQRALGFVWHGHRRCNGDVKCRRENALSEPRRAIEVIVPRLWSRITHRLPDSLVSSIAVPAQTRDCLLCGTGSP